MILTLSSLTEDKLIEALERTEGKSDVTIVLPTGKLCLEKTVSFKTAATSHDDGSGEVEEKSAHICLKGRRNFTLKGSENGKTLLLAHNDGKAQTLKPSVLWTDGCDGLTLENLEFGFDKPTTFYGGVVKKKKDTIIIKPGRKDYPQVLPSYCMNRFRNGALSGASLTIGFGLDNTMKKREDGFFELEDVKVAEKTEIGDGLSWHLSELTDFLVYIGNSSNLTLKNIRITDASGFGMLTESIENIVANRVVIKPREGYQSVSRDGWKIFRCSGKVSVTSSHFEGTRMDGQNVHSNYMIITSVSGNTVTAEMKYAPTPLKENTCVTFYGPEKKETAKITSWKNLSSTFRPIKQEKESTAAEAVVGKSNRYNTYLITLSSISSSIRVGDTLVPDSMSVNEYRISDSIFRNIAGAGNMVRAKNAVIERNTYENTMNSAIFIGSEWHTHREGVNPESVIVRECTFDNAGFVPRYGDRGYGAVAAVAEGFGNEKVIKSIIVEDCTFLNLERAVENRNAERFETNNSRYINVKETI